jgi:putative transposase
MAARAVARTGVSIALACRTFGVSDTCYRYSPRLNDENEMIADLLTGLSKAKKAWGFGLCFLYLRNVKGHPWNHKRVYRIYRALELNLKIKPRKRLKRDKPDELAVPDAPNRVWSMEFASRTSGSWPTVLLMAGHSGCSTCSTISIGKGSASRSTSRCRQSG